MIKATIPDRNSIQYALCCFKMWDQASRTDRSYTFTSMIMGQWPFILTECNHSTEGSEITCVQCIIKVYSHFYINVETDIILWLCCLVGDSHYCAYFKPILTCFQKRTKILFCFYFPFKYSKCSLDTLAKARSVFKSIFNSKWLYSW